MNTKTSARQAVDTFLAATRELNGREIQERPPWHHHATLDAIRHVAHGISDDNPLWTDPAYAASAQHGRPMAPPAFLCSVTYPVLHGAPVPVPLSSLIAELGFQWYRPVLEGDTVRATSRQTDAFETRDQQEQPIVCVLSETSYSNQRDEPVGLARATLVRAVQREGDLRVQRDVYRYSDSELARIADAQRNECRTGNQRLDVGDVEPGSELPPLVRGPLTIGDMVCWQAAIGPSYRPGALGYRDTLAAPHSTVIHPVTGWPVKYSLQHEDFLLASQRGMPAPFDNGVMRFAWLTPLLTNWVGDNGWLKSLTVRLHAPNLYGDATWYRGTVVEKSTLADAASLRVDIAGTNQLGETTTTGEAELVVPALPSAARDQHRTVHITSHAGSDPAHPELIHRRFESLAARRPAAPAVRAGVVQLSYREVNRRANQLARHIRQTGVATGEPVAVCLARSADWIVAELAVLKAGGAFVPLDPAYPRERLQKMLADCRSRVAIASGELAALLQKVRQDPVTVIDPARIDESGDPEDGENLELDIAGDQAAYLIYTSGSTGEPNGVIVPHRSLALYLAALRDSLQLTPKDVFLHTASFSFSASIRQTFLPLSLGAQLIVADDAERRDPLALLERMQQERVTVWDTVPGVWQQTIESFNGLAKSRRKLVLDNSLRFVLVTGEALSWDIPRMWRAAFGAQAELVNLYSQTETAGTASLFPIPRGMSAERGIVPLGRAVPHTHLYVLDPDRRPVPNGEPGEIWVGGDRLASGYLNRPELTEHRFHADPFRSSPDARMYRTGDVGRRGEDGVVAFVGRVDHRINIRGYRVEPAEVEAEIASHSDVKQAAVVARQDPSGDTRLVAYVAARPEASPTALGKRRYRLPNGLAIAQANKHETDFTYRAVFEDQTYLKHGVTLRDGDCIFDVGANIGLFSLFVGLSCQAPRIFAFEPNPDVFQILSANARLYGLDARLMPCGLDRAPRSAAFTAFRGFSILSGLHADEDAERELVRAFTANQRDSGRPDVDELLSGIDEILDERFQSRRFDVPLRTLSSVMDDEGIERIDLLKINVEKSELGVLAGIRSEHWERIDQVVVKVDVTERVGEIVQLLQRHGFETIVDQDDLMMGSRIETVYAIRPSRDRKLAPHAHLAQRRTAPGVEDRILTAGSVRQHVARNLPDFMVPSVFVMLEDLPRSPHGKVDRSALPEPEWSHPDVATDYAPPTNDLQQALMRIWAEVLGIDSVGLRDSFLDLGGDSIKAIRIVNRVRQELDVDVPVGGMLASGTVASLAETISAGSASKPGVRV